MKTIVLTGANRGLGQALHELLLTRDFSSDKKIFITRRAIAMEVSASAHADYLALDLAAQTIDVRDIQLAPGSEEVIFINNAGVIDPIVSALEIAPEDAEVAMRVNCWAPLQLARHLAMLSEGIGARLFILNVSSGAANRPIRGWLAYCVSKAAVKMALDVLKAENAHVEVMHFDPGAMDTDMQETIRFATEAAMPGMGLSQGFKTEQRLKPPSEAARQVGKIIGCSRS